MKFGQLILRRIVKIVDTKCQILRLRGMGRRGGEGNGGKGTPVCIFKFSLE